MVNNSAIQLVLLIFLSMLSSSIFAETQLNASVDRSKIYEMDTLNLTIQGQVDVDFSFGGLMNFGLGQSETPDISGLENDFEILDTQQSYNMQSINGESKAQVLWRYTLSPKNAGVLEIPSAKYKGAKTDPIQITVIEGKSPKNASEPPALFIEVETDKKTAYVQEQIIYTLRLYTQGLINGELSEPSSTDAIIEPFGEQKKYYRMAFNQRYEVVERQYLIFPQKSGSLTINEQVFQGISLKQGRRTRLKDMSDPIQLTIKPPAASFSGKNWLPATSLFLNESWQGDIDNLMVGDSITRKIELSALGLLGSGLPPITMSENPLYKLYIDKPVTESVQHESGAQSKRSDSFAIVAINNGEVALNEIRIPWWDTVNDVERVAVIPARTLTVAANPQLPTQENKQPETFIDLQDQPAAQNGTTQNKPPEAKKIDSIMVAKPIEDGTSHLWQTIAGIFLAIWIITVIYFSKKIKTLKAMLNAIPLPKQPSETSEKEKYNAAINALKNDDKKITQKILSWLSHYNVETGSQSRLNSLQDIKLIAPSIYELLSTYEASSYSKDRSMTFDKNDLITSIKDFRDKNLGSLSADSNPTKTKQSKLKAQELEPFYK
mgnify:CR=1 FL=1